MLIGLHPSKGNKGVSVPPESSFARPNTNTFVPNALMHRHESFQGKDDTPILSLF